MVLACRKCGLAQHNINVPLACLLFAVLVFLHPRNAWAQSCSTSSSICPSAPLAPNRFYIHDLGGNFQSLGGGRCIDTGPPQSWAQGSPVFINTCNHTVGQEIYVAEINSEDNDHDVGLAVYPTITGRTALATTTTGATNAGFCIGVHGGTVAANAALELQTCNPLSPAQRFAFDGDAILMGLQTSGRVTRDFVIERQNGSTVPQTPLVVATRLVSEEEPLRLDARYFRFDAVDGSGAAPTSGFLTVCDKAGLISAAQCGWGTVVQIDPSQPLKLETLRYPPIGLKNGTTIRGYRSQTFNGPEIRTCDVEDWDAFQVTGQAIRFTGFRLHGPNGDSRCPQVNENQNENSDGIEVDRVPDGSLSLPSVWIDHMEISQWPAAGVGGGLLPGVGQPGFPGTPNVTQPGPCTGCVYPDTPIAIAVGNFVHNDTYEVGIGGPIFAQIRANVFYGWANQPATSRQMSCDGGYAAMDNLFLTEVVECSIGKKCSSDDVDMHGSLNYGSWHHGLVGDYFDVGWNTFLRTSSPLEANVNQRGYSCRFTEIHQNVFLQTDQGNAITQDYNAPVLYNNSLGAQNPTEGKLLVGDFDGDGIDDVFLATGAAWYYSSGGQAEWRYLNRASDPTSALLLGDFDGDGRTDVLAVHGPNIDVSWAGVSAWQTINQTAWPLADLAVGDFDGLGPSDLLLATGTQWFLASGGQNWKSWPVPYTDTIPNLRLGHFTDNFITQCKTQTQILRVQKGQWQVTCLGLDSWKPIGPAPVNSVTGLVAGDFDGDGYTELAQSGLLGWQLTSPGRNSSWSTPVIGPIQRPPIGNFQGGKQEGMIVWSDKHFYYAHACTPDYRCSQKEPQQLSRQPMR